MNHVKDIGLQSCSVFVSGRSKKYWEIGFESLRG